VEQATLLLSQHPRRTTEKVTRQDCTMASSARICANQQLLVALLTLLINSGVRIQVAPTGLDAVANVVVPVVSLILNSIETRADLKPRCRCELLHHVQHLKINFLHQSF